MSLKLIDVGTGKPYFEKPKFLDLNEFSNFYELLRLVSEALSGSDVASIDVDPESHYLLVRAEGHVLAFDLEKRQQISVEGKLKGVGDLRAAFVGPDKMYVVEQSESKGLYKAHIVSFPEGKVLGDSQIGDQGIRGATKGSLMIVSPLKDYAVGVFDPQAAKILVGLKLPTIDIWDKKVATEDATGGLFLGQIDSASSMDIPLPLGPLPEPRAGAFSRDGKYLVLSLRNRSVVWDLQTGKQLRLMRPMRSLWIDDQDHVFGQLPKYRGLDAMEMEITLPAITTNDLGKYDDKEFQYGDFAYTFKPKRGDNSTAYNATLQVKKMGRKPRPGRATTPMRRRFAGPRTETALCWRGT